MEKHFTPQPERFWEKYAIVPFFLAFTALNCSIGYLATKDIKKEQESFRQECKVKSPVYKTKNTR